MRNREDLSYNNLLKSNKDIKFYMVEKKDILIFIKVFTKDKDENQFITSKVDDDTYHTLQSCVHYDKKRNEYSLVINSVELDVINQEGIKRIAIDAYIKIDDKLEDSIVILYLEKKYFIKNLKEQKNKFNPRINNVKYYNGDQYYFIVDKSFNDYFESWKEDVKKQVKE